jgi:hypothetical protein
MKQGGIFPKQCIYEVISFSSSELLHITPVQEYLDCAKLGDQGGIYFQTFTETILAQYSYNDLVFIH